VIPKRFKKGNRHGEKGQALVEFVFVLPLFLVLVLAVVDFGMGLHAWISVTNGAREGARLGSVEATAGEIETKVRAVTSTLDQAKLTVTTTNAQGDSGEGVTVKVDYQYDLITPLGGIIGVLGGSIGSTLNLSSQSEMRLE